MLQSLTLGLPSVVVCRPSAPANRASLLKTCLRATSKCAAHIPYLDQRRCRKWLRSLLDHRFRAVSAGIADRVTIGLAHLFHAQCGNIGHLQKGQGTDFLFGQSCCKGQVSLCRHAVCGCLAEGCYCRALDMPSDDNHRRCS